MAAATRASDRAHNADALRIEAVQLGVLSPDEIRRMSVVRVSNPRLYERGAPAEHGLLDLRMGSTHREFTCRTCAQPPDVCPGHMGHIELPLPCFHPTYLDTVARVLNCVCLQCSALLLPDTPALRRRQARLANGKSRLRAVYERLRAMRVRVCGGNGGGGGGEETADGYAGCGAVQPKVVREGLKLVTVWPETAALKSPSAAQAAERARRRAAEQQLHAQHAGDDTPSPPLPPAPVGGRRARRVALPKGAEPGKRGELSSRDAYDVLKRVSDAHCRLLGFDPPVRAPGEVVPTRHGNTMPAWLLITVLPVPPPCVRPAVYQPNSKRQIAHDSLTLQLSKILKKARELTKQFVHDIPAWSDQNAALLQYHVAAYIDNQGHGFPKLKLDPAHGAAAAGKAMVSLTERFKGKHGRIRGNLMGKRTNFSARTVIGPDPSMRLDELGVPASMARTLTYPERVNARNRARLQRAVDAGPDAADGANYVVQQPALAGGTVAGAGGGTPQHRRINLRTRAARAAAGDYVPPLRLRDGDVVERHLRTGDPVIFNRQPSLHKFSMMGHTARVMRDGVNTFRMPLPVTSPYNADFDGDEVRAARRAVVSHAPC